MKRRHVMPYGSFFDGGIGRFRLWAPTADRVELRLPSDAEPRDLPMKKSEGGWFSLDVPGLRQGQRYLFRIDGRIDVPDPASRHNPGDVHGASALADPHGYDWSDAGWRGRPWHEAVIYELHVGTFTPRGTFEAVIDRLDYLVDLGVTAIELMPVADFPGRRNWGYDGVLPFAPDDSYGSPDELKQLVDAAHHRGLMMFLDVVYNHFGPEGNYLAQYAPRFFNEAVHTPWGAALNFDGPDCAPVRGFFIHNALYWLEEFHFDGLRLDAVHAITDAGTPHVLEELSAAVRAGPGRSRQVHLIFENDDNESAYLKRDRDGRPLYASAQWNDDIHHALHVLITGEKDGYYADYAQQPLPLLGRALAQGFAYQGDFSPHRGRNRGQASAGLPPTAFVSFLQCHDQVGNRAFGERIANFSDPAALPLAVSCILLSPQIPMLFMGEEFSASSPFLFFCDFGGELADAVREGRRREFKSFARFGAPETTIPDPGDKSSFLQSRLSWNELENAFHGGWRDFYRKLLRIRAEKIVPHLQPRGRHAARFAVGDGGGLTVQWQLGAANLGLQANFSATPLNVDPLRGDVIFRSDKATGEWLPPWGVSWTLQS